MLKKRRSNGSKIPSQKFINVNEEFKNYANWTKRDIMKDIYNYIDDNIETTINLRILGYLIGEGENDDRPLVKVEESIVEVTFPRESGVIPGEPSFFED